MTSMILRALAGISLCCTGGNAVEIQLTVTLPTPLAHYETYDVRQASLKLMAEIMNDLDPDSRQKVTALMQSGGEALPPGIDPDEIIQSIEDHGLLKYKPDALEVFLHGSRVLDAIPAANKEDVEPIIHDFLLAFLDGLPMERMLDRIEELVKAKDADRGEKILILASKIPSLQKVGQIIGHLGGIPPDIQEALQSLEDGISTMTRDEIVAEVTKELGEEEVKKYQIRFAEEILAEASVGAVLRGSFLRSPGAPREDFVCKIVKPYVQIYLPEEMDVISHLVKLADDYSDFYHITGFDLGEFFGVIRSQLEKEIQITEEQQNFRAAFEFYRNDKRVKVPEIYSFSTDNVTFMEFLRTQKLTESYPGDRAKNGILAERLATIMTFEAMFSATPVAVFHGDPHGGNIMRLVDDPTDPYRLAMLDWGLMGQFPREQRMELVHLNLAMQERSKRKMMRNVGALIRGGLPADPVKIETIDRMVSKTLEKDGSTFELYGELLQELLLNGFSLDDEMSLFIKSQVTIAGILKELDPDLSPDKLTQTQVRSLVKREMPKRILLVVAPTYRGYRSMLSNADVFSQAF